MSVVPALYRSSQLKLSALKVLESNDLRTFCYVGKYLSIEQKKMQGKSR